MKIGEYIREKRREKDMSQRDLAAAANISNAEISRIESGIRQSPAPEVLKSIAAALHISTETLYEIAGFIEQKTDTASAHIQINPGDYICVSDLTPDEIADVKNFIGFIKSKR